MQEPILFNQTIKDNVKYGNPQATDSMVRRACEQANALQFIESNFEEMDKDQRKETAFKDFNSKVEELAAEMINFDALK
jgi:ABC-type multidrug transport system fused ATPase/permease subunit